MDRNLGLSVPRCIDRRPLRDPPDENRVNKVGAAGLGVQCLLFSKSKEIHESKSI